MKQIPNNIILSICLSILAMPCIASGRQYSEIKDCMDLSGQWEVKLPGGANDGSILLPGTTDLAGYGFPLDKESLSRDEQFRRLARKNSFVGNAVYSREIDIPKTMAGKPLELILERVMWKSIAKIDGKPLDNEEYSLVAPHRHALKEGLSAGKHILTLEVDNSRQYDISFNNLAHAYTNDTQTMWNGVLGKMIIRSIPDVDIISIEIYPSVYSSEIRVKAILGNNTGKVKKEHLVFDVEGKDIFLGKKVSLKPGKNIIEAVLPSAGLELWNEFHPAVYSLKVSTKSGASAKSNFGMREVDNKNGIRVNDIPIFLRGTLECCVFPLTGVPPTEKQGWLKTFETARQWGLNHLRFHSWCPPKAAFDVADSIGFYLQVELPVWSLKIGEDSAAENFLKDEFERIVENYGNHPSFIMLSVGNELQHDFTWLNETVRGMKARDSRHLYTTTSFTFEKGHGGHPEPEDDYLVTQWTDKGWVRGQGVFEQEIPCFNKNYSSSLEGLGVPLVSHEIGQYAVYPSMKEIEKYTGILEPLNLKNISSDLEQKGMLEKSNDMTMASGKLAAILYKEEIERALKTPGMSGYQLLGLQDFPGQGTALVGLLDAFWDNKGAVDADWFREFSAPVVPLLEYNSAVYNSSDMFEAKVLMSNYSDTILNSGNLQWSLTVEGAEIPFASGIVATNDIMPGTTAMIGNFQATLDKVCRPSSVIVELRMSDDCRNTWRIFVYPPVDVNIGDVICTQNIDEALEALDKGRKVLYSPQFEKISGIESKFLPVFWSPVHFPKQAGTMGIMNNPDHPALRYFPNNGHTDWQWWRPVKEAKVINLDRIPDIEPIVGVIDNFVNNRKLGYIFEAKCGNGELIFSSIDLFGPKSESIEIDMLKKSLIDYMNGRYFSPMHSVSEEFIKSLVAE